MQTYIGTEVLEQAEEPLVLLIALVALPDAGNTKHGATLREEVEYQEVARLHAIHHLWTRILRPSLNHPDGLGIHTLHGLHHRLTSLGIVDVGIVVALMERIHRVIVGLTKEFGEFIII